MLSNSGKMQPERNNDTPPDPGEASNRRRGLGSAVRSIAQRFGRKDGMADKPGSSLRLTRMQRILLREGLADIREEFDDPAGWQEAADEAFLAEEELGIEHLGAGFCMWTSSMAALTHGSWWLLMPGCGAPVLQDSVCKSLYQPFLEGRPEYDRLRQAINEGEYSALANVLERTERIRCMLALHVRER